MDEDKGSVASDTLCWLFVVLLIAAFFFASHAGGFDACGSVPCRAAYDAR
jgi:hypothetical protein